LSIHRIARSQTFTISSHVATKTAIPVAKDFYIAGDRHFIKVIDRHLFLIQIVGGENYETFSIEPSLDAVLDCISEILASRLQRFLSESRHSAPGGLAR
jgi:hypothetical protein